MGDGELCGSTHQLEFDHDLEVALGGGPTIDNIRLLCKSHNLMKAENHLGRELMARFRGDLARAWALNRAQVTHPLQVALRHVAACWRERHLDLCLGCVPAHGRQGKHPVSSKMLTFWLRELAVTRSSFPSLLKSPFVTALRPAGGEELAPVT